MPEEVDKKSLSERDICTKYITPALVSHGWDSDVLLQAVSLITLLTPSASLPYQFSRNTFSHRFLRVQKSRVANR